MEIVQGHKYRVVRGSHNGKIQEKTLVDNTYLAWVVRRTISMRESRILIECLPEDKVDVDTVLRLLIS